MYFKLPPKISKNTKYNSRIEVIDGITFRSRLEAKYYLHLKALKSVGNVISICRQVPFDLTQGMKYIVDFMVFYSDGHVEFIEIKGQKTPVYIIKKKLMEQFHPEIEVKEVFKGDF
jgi:hypothetical protein